MEAITSKTHPSLEGIRFGIGTWAWGDRIFWGYGRDYTQTDLQQVFKASLDAGINFFDTAESYGQGVSEAFLGEFARQDGRAIKVATKFMPFPWRLRRNSLLKALQGSLKRLQMQRIDLYQIHQPLPPVKIETWMEAMLEAHREGLIAAVGISNYNLERMQRAHDTLARHGVPLASNQVEYSLINRKIEKNGVLRACHEQGVTLIAYSPLGLGLLTGKYTPDKPLQGFRGSRYNRKFIGQIQPLISLLRKIGAEHAGKTPAQVALNWAIHKGTLVIPGAKNLEQLEMNLGALGWELSEAEVNALDEMSDRVLGTK